MSWFSAKSPVDEESQAWIESSFQWLMEELGRDVVLSTQVILPTEEFFPDIFDGSRASIRTMLERVCEYMDVDPATIEIRFYQNEDESVFHPLAVNGQTTRHALGTYQKRRDGKFQISLDTSQTSNPEMMVATIAHELGHVILLGEERLDPDHPDHEPLTDLLTVFYGMGIFNANSAVVFEQWINPQYQGWKIGGGGYLSEEEFGYALAYFSAVRNETDLEWSRHLNTNLRSYFKSSTRYIKKNGGPAVVSLANS